MIARQAAWALIASCGLGLASACNVPLGNFHSPDAGAGDGPMTTCALPPPGLMGWWPGDGSARDLTGGVDASMNGGVAFAPATAPIGNATLTGEVNQAFMFDGASGYVDLSDQASLRGLRALTLDAWVNVSASSADTQYIYTELGHLSSEGARVQFYIAGGSGKLVLDVKPYDDLYPGADRLGVASSQPLNLGEWTNVAATWMISSEGIWATVFVNGVATAATTGASIGGPIVDSSPADGVNDIGGNPSLLGMFKGGIDEFVMFNRALDPSEIGAILSAGTRGMCKP